MTTEQGFRLVTRALTIYSLFWFVEEILILPGDMMSLAHHFHRLGLFTEENYWVHYYAIITCERVIKIMLSFWFAGWFYRGGAALRRFFRVESDSPTTD